MIFRDVLGKRLRPDGYPLYSSSYKLLSAISNKEVPTSHTSVLSLLGIAAEAKKICRSRAEAERLSLDFINRAVIGHFDVVELTRDLIDMALQSNISEFEDRVIFFSARKCGASNLATRNISDFRSICENSMRVYTPEQLVGYPNWSPRSF